MEIKRYDIPKLSRNKYGVATAYLVGGGSATNGNDGNGGGSTQPSVKVVDNLTSPSRTDALSANQGKVLNESKLSKEVDDTANGKITFNKGIECVGKSEFNNDISINGYSQDERRGMGITLDMNTEYTTATTDLFDARVSVITDNIKNSDYYNDVKGWAVFRDIDNHFNLDIDNINVRGHLDVHELNIEEAKYIGGKIYCTKASLKIKEVRTYGTVYRCLFNNEKDGVIIHNQFQVGDLAFCQTFNNNTPRRWWREVIAVSERYIDVSKKRCELNSDIPQVGDEVIQLGHLADKERQGAVIIEPLSIKVIDGINTYTLPAPTIDLNPKLSIIKGQLINADTNENVTTSLSNLDNKIKVQAERITTDENGLITNINKNGLVVTDEFSTLFSQAVDADKDIVKQAQISTFIDKDEANNLISNATIQADKINFLGKTIINNNFVVDEQGNLDIKGKIEANEGKIGGFRINDKGLYNLPTETDAIIKYVRGNKSIQIGNDIGVKNSGTLINIENHDKGYAMVIDGWDRTQQYKGVLIQGASEINAVHPNSEIKIKGASFDYRNIVIGNMYANDDFVTLDGVRECALPTEGVTSGKRIMVKNIANHRVTIIGRIMRCESNAIIDAMEIGNYSCMFVYADGYWVLFYCG